MVVWSLLSHNRYLLSHNYAMVIVPSDSSRRRFSMSKYIPDNQKHLTLENRTYIEHELPKGTSFKNIAAYFCSIHNDR